MSYPTIIDTNRQLEEALQGLLEQVRKEGDRVSEGKIVQLLHKAASGRMGIAFCGHFSAGKSSLVNRLCGHELLPSSPIPTSANIVTIADGEAGARIVYRQNPGVAGAPRTDVVPLHELAEHCRNGEAIETVEIAYPIPFLGSAAALLDTPGIDSTDDAHHLATESALHLADVVFYVMDYNHVQSEINFAFTKKMKEWGKPLYLIVNMIDKHREAELPFAAYRQSVDEAFAAWGIEPDGVLYISGKHPDHPLSEFARLQWLLGRLIAQREPLTLASLAKSAQAIAAAHAAWAAERSEPAKQVLRSRLAADDGAAEAERERSEAEAELLRLEGLPQEREAAARKEVAAVLDNANLTPAATRDLAHEYLQSRKPGFKVGWLGSAAKTAKERERRLEAFHRDFAHQLETQAERHVQQSVTRAFADCGLDDAAVAREAGAIQIEATPEWLAGQVNEGAGFGGDYTLTYAKQVAGEIKAQYRKAAFEAAERLAGQLAAELAPRVAALRERIAALDERLADARELARLEREDAAYAAALAAPLAAAETPLPPLPQPADAPPPAAPAGAPAAAASAAAAPSQAAGAAPLARAAAPAAGTPAAAAAALAPAAAAARPATALADGEHRRRMQAAAARLMAAARELDGVAPLAAIRRSLEEKAERLAHNRFTVALFGAFSAGKSSFANALIGERVLPVSPNPTTAAINKIMPPDPDNGWPHGTAKVRMKSRERLESDILYSLEVLGEPAADLEEALRRIAGLKASRVPGKGKPHYTFLKAVERGWAAAMPNIGRELKATAEEFAGYAADEAKSCFVEWIELYYSNPLTDQGVVLVDTPGADSINARHTGVAFEYIKNADAILFVTYYNHAFSHADREFLLQLGRVKDSFELDKMFFIVNAADLASSPEELDGVTGHVKDNLQQHGIRHPRIYPLSSYNALEGRLTGDAEAVQASGIEAFERDFAGFAFGELTEIAVRAGEADVRRAAEVLHKLADSARADAGERARQAEALHVALQQIDAELKRPETELEREELAKEIRELVYYIKQRTSYRFGELFALAFNPADFREDSRDSKAALQSAWNDLRRMLAFDLTQEVLATTLRIENKINRLAERAAQRWTERIRKDIPSFEPAGYEPLQLVRPEQEAAFEPDEITVKWLSGFYKNGKQFFEGDGRTQLRRELGAKLGEPMARFAQAQADLLVAAYEAQLDEGCRQLAERMLSELKAHADGLLSALEARVDPQELIGRQEALLNLLS
ncbi:dynamin family protein [Paenibacillus ginsengihumi]|uniref:dynamin family protein n=1 Tax=Paenibacillus ginsengihumi TaxID=431596 RepID=UPI0003768D2C|nr:dynamin family protein [Paenibacillus ginsengihumi]